jgi:hypothetical protein
VTGWLSTTTIPILIRCRYNRPIGYGESSLSAAWGLVGANYLLPEYDITFSTMAESYKRRRKQNVYRDFCALKDESDDIVFLVPSGKWLELGVARSPGT